MLENGSAGTVILGLGGLVLLAVPERDGELEQAVETAAGTARCGGCGAAASSTPGGRCGCGIFPPAGAR